MGEPKALKECTCISGHRDPDGYALVLSFDNVDARNEVFDWLDDLIGKEEDQAAFVKRLISKDS